jgi:uncharacterized RmlC-like cupin family protein
MYRQTRVIALCAFAVSLPLSSCADADAEGRTTSRPSKDVITREAALRWETKPSGVQVAVLYGDTARAEPFGLRLKYPAGYRKDPHYHPYDAFVTVLSGSYYRGYGTTFDREKGIHLVTGTFSKNPAGVSHYEWVEEPAELEVHALGPWGTAYVDAAGERLEPGQHDGRGGACGGVECMFDAAGVPPTGKNKPIVIKPDEITWTKRADGDEIALLYGDPSKSGPFVMRVRSPIGSREMPHHHNQAAFITFLSGTFHFGTGTRFDESNAGPLATGDVIRVRSGLPHFKWNDAPSVVEVHATGPWKTIASDQ